MEYLTSSQSFWTNQSRAPPPVRHRLGPGRGDPVDLPVVDGFGHRRQNLDEVPAVGQQDRPRAGQRPGPEIVSDDISDFSWRSAMIPSGDARVIG